MDKIMTNKNNNNNKVNTRETTVKKFYGVDTAEKVADSIISNKIFILINTLLIITSSVITITLNITNLEGIKNQNAIIKTLQMEIMNKVETISKLEQIVKGDLKPKVTLINSAVSVSIPGQISNLQTKMSQKLKFIEDSVIDQCTCNPLSGIFPSKEPPKEPHPGTEDDDDTSDDDKVDDSIQAFDYPSFTVCNNSDETTSIIPGPNLYAVPNLSIKEDEEDECVTNPSFSIGTSIYMYSQEIRKTDCKSGPLTGIKIILGRIVDKGQFGPQVSPLLVWDVPKPETINSCAVVAEDEVGWALCSITSIANSGEPIPYLLSGFKLFKFEPDSEVVQYVLGSKSFRLDRVYHTLYVGKGGGAVRYDGLYFEGFGVITNIGKEQPLCNHGKCSGSGSYTPICLSAMSMMGDTDFLVVSNIIKVVDTNIGKPVITVQTFKIQDTYKGSHGRIYQMDNNYGIYLASSSWNRYLKFGTTNTLIPTEVEWSKLKDPIMDIQNNCHNTNQDMCPAVCSSYGYEDIFPLNIEGNAMTYMSMSRNGEGTSNFIVARSQDNYVNTMKALGEYFKIITATTSCFTFKDEAWCIVVNEGQHRKGDKQRIFAHSYKLKKSCIKRSKITDLATTSITINNRSIR
uniref:Attachment glycoprotein n=1 Tax=Jingmen Crocidura shantungensis henipavirus 2 TaxID=2928972 RepID=A0AB38ZK77_9MONO